MESNVRVNGRMIVEPHYLSWVAYIKFFVWLLVIGVISFALLPVVNVIFPLGLFAICSIGIIYQCLYYSKCCVFADEEGVWFSRGLFPWQKGVTGVRWSDVNEAMTNVGFIPYWTHSYRVVVTNRYKTVIEINLSNVAHGDEFVGQVNRYVASQQ